MISSDDEDMAADDVFDLNCTPPTTGGPSQTMLTSTPISKNSRSSFKIRVSEIRPLSNRQNAKPPAAHDQQGDRSRSLIDNLGDDEENRPPFKGRSEQSMRERLLRKEHHKVIPKNKQARQQIDSDSEEEEGDGAQSDESMQQSGNESSASGSETCSSPGGSVVPASDESGEEEDESPQKLAKQPPVAEKPTTSKAVARIDDVPPQRGPPVIPAPHFNADFYERMFNADKEKRLFAGKMTVERYDHVNAMTNDAVTSIHSALNSAPDDMVFEETPKGLLIDLMPHQKHGLAWMLWRERQNPPAGILADDMGLGKTLAMIALILYKKNQRRDGIENPKEAEIRGRVASGNRLTVSRATLVVAPASLINQWEKEVSDRVKMGLLRVAVYHGQKRENNPKILAKYDIVITTYGTLSSELNNIDSTRSVFTNIAWERIILDEAHKIKNRTAKVSKVVCLIPSVYRWCLTGTPIHNELWDLFSLIRFMRVRPFSEDHHWKQYIMMSNAKNKERLNTMVKGLLLRRTKVQLDVVTKMPIVQLPERTFTLVELNMKGLEDKCYQIMFEASRQRAQEIIAEGQGRRVKPPTVKINPFLVGGQRVDDNFQAMSCLFALLLRLRQACVHLCLTRHALDLDAFKENGVENVTGDDIAELEKSISHLFVTERQNEIQENGETVNVEEVFKPQYGTEKINAVLAQMEYVLARKEKCVIVSQWTKVFEILEIHMKQRQIRYTAITGQTAVASRQTVVNDFNSKSGKADVMLLSLTAGGVGLNLIGANHLFVVDLHWNPAMENQACDRIYRMGQTKPVYIHKFVVNNTIEQRVLELQKRKTELATSVLEGVTAKSKTKITMNDLKYLFDLDNKGRADEREAR